jgi:phosphomannomutase
VIDALGAASGGLEVVGIGVDVVDVARMRAVIGRRPRFVDRVFTEGERRYAARFKDQWEGDPVLARAIAQATERLAGDGRILVRPSGTEPSLRVMVEGPDAALVAELADSLAALAGERLH